MIGLRRSSLKCLRQHVLQVVKVIDTRLHRSGHQSRKRLQPETVSFKRCQHRTNTRSNSLRLGSAPPPPNLLVPVSFALSLSLIVLQRRSTPLIRCCKLLCCVNANVYLLANHTFAGGRAQALFVGIHSRCLQTSLSSNAFRKNLPKLPLPMGSQGPA